MSIINLHDVSSFQTSWETDQDNLYKLLIKLKTYYEDGTPPKDVAKALFFASDKVYWNLVIKMKDYKVESFNQGGKQALKFVQNVFAVFDKISEKRTINLNDLIVGMKYIHKKQIKNVQQEKDDESSGFGGIFDEIESYG